MNDVHSSGGENRPSWSAISAAIGTVALILGIIYWRDVVVFREFDKHYAEITEHDNKIRNMELSLVNSRIISLDRLLP